MSSREREHSTGQAGGIFWFEGFFVSSGEREHSTGQAGGIFWFKGFVVVAANVRLHRASRWHLGFANEGLIRSRERETPPGKPVASLYSREKVLFVTASVSTPPGKPGHRPKAVVRRGALNRTETNCGS